MAQCKTAVTPLLTHWSYCSLALSQRYSLVTENIFKITIRHGQLEWSNITVVTIVPVDGHAPLSASPCAETVTTYPGLHRLLSMEWYLIIDMKMQN